MKKEEQLYINYQNFNIQSLLPQNNKNKPKRKGYPLSSVLTSSQSSCPFCKFLLSAIEDVEKPIYFQTHVFKGKAEIQPEIYIHMTLSPSSSRSLLSLELGDRFQRSQKPMSSRDPHRRRRRIPPRRKVNDVEGRYIGDHPTSPTYFATAKKWIEECEEFHEKCSRREESSSSSSSSSHLLLPTRVIEIVRRNNNKREIYLRQTSTFSDSDIQASSSSSAAYITLTHRWNENTSKCITTTSNLHDRLQGKGGFEDSLPPLFEDAFTIAEKLEARYIWIDSLCIIQSGDDLADWRKEAPNMAHYYQNSLFTLAFTNPSPSLALQRYTQPWETGNLVRLPYRDK
ncbi:hypothetical protein GGS20DRAFT_335475 [Poronia punctata]|nr:hypothetical protein GGS20DRAFT_335475 [Poronia punctata]